MQQATPSQAVPARRALDRFPARMVTPSATDLGHSPLVHDSWRSYFARFPAGARLLDIAPGIGAVALIAQEISQARGRGFEVHSLDQASTLSADPLDINGIRFHARRYDRSTPFADAYFDAISAQWAPPDDDTSLKGISELRRILKPGGWLRLMYHAHGGATHEQCLGRMQAVDTLLDKLRLLEHARAMFDAVFVIRSALAQDAVHSAMQALSTQQTYASTAQWARFLMRDTPNCKAGDQIFQLIDDCWEQRDSLDHSTISAHLDRVEGEMRAAQERMRAACALVVDETRVHRIGRLFQSAGFEQVKVTAFRDAANALVGWDLQAA